MSRLYEGMSLPEVTQHLFLRDDPARADLIFVFGGSNPERAERAAELYRQGFAPRILVTGGGRLGAGCTEAEALKDVLLAREIPETAILAETSSANTLENVLLGRAALAEAGWLEGLSSALLVSAPYHMRRASQVFKRHFADVAARCCPDRRTDLTADNWSLSAQGRQRVLRELEKVRTYVYRGDG
ncbi:MAG: YdcF family protein [bacterium]|nr:YdcF family protein [bacterium]